MHRILTSRDKLFCKFTLIFKVRSTIKKGSYQDVFFHMQQPRTLFYTPLEGAQSVP